MANLMKRKRTTRKQPSPDITTKVIKSWPHGGKDTVVGEKVSLTVSQYARLKREHVQPISEQGEKA